jgi:hypothetical protein
VEQIINRIAIEKRLFLSFCPYERVRELITEENRCVTFNEDTKLSEDEERVMNYWSFL